MFNFRHLLISLAAAAIASPSLANSVPENKAREVAAIQSAKVAAQIAHEQRAKARADADEWARLKYQYKPLEIQFAAINLAPWAYLKALRDNIQKIDAAPFNAYSVATLGGNCAVQGSVMVQGANGVSQCLGAGVAGQVLQSGGPGANVSWLTTAGSGTVTSVAATVPAFMTVGGSPIATNGTLAFSFNSQTANSFLAAPNGSAGVPSFRAMLPADLGSQAAASILGNPTGAAGASSFYTISSLTDIATIAAADRFEAFQSASGAKRQVSLAEILAFVPPGANATAGIIPQRVATLPLNFVADYGAVCDGSTNNDSALTKIIADAATLNRPMYFPGCANKYNYSTAHAISAGSFAYMFGDGEKESILQYTGTGTGLFVNPGSQVPGYFQTRYMGFYNTVATNAQGGLIIQNSPLSVVDHVAFYASWQCLWYLGGDFGARVSNSNFINCGAPGFVSAAATNASGSGGTNGIGVYYVNGNINLSGVSVAGGGSGYAAGDYITLTGGTGTQAQLQVTSVSGGVITGIVLAQTGLYTTVPANPAAQGSTTGAGTGATFNLTNNAATLNVTWTASVLTVNSVASNGKYAILPASPANISYVSGPAINWTGASVTLTDTGPSGGGIVFGTDVSSNNAVISQNYLAAGLNGSGYGTAINVPNGNNITIEKNDIESNGVGLAAGGSVGNGTNSIGTIDIKDNYIENAVLADIYFYGSAAANTWVNGATIEGNWLGASANVNWNYLTNFTYKNNTTYNNGIYIAATSNGLIQNPVTWGTGGISASGGNVSLISPPAVVANLTTAPLSNFAAWKGSKLTVTDAAQCQAGQTPTGSGSVVCDLIDNGSAWIADGLIPANNASAPPAGALGYSVSATLGTTLLTTSPVNYSTLSLTAGHWLCWTQTNTTAGSTSIAAQAWLSTVSATNPGFPNAGGYTNYNTGYVTNGIVGPIIFRLASTTNIYFGAMVNASTPSMAAYTQCQITD